MGNTPPSQVFQPVTSGFQNLGNDISNGITNLGNNIESGLTVYQQEQILVIK